MKIGYNLNPTFSEMLKTYVLIPLQHILYLLIYDTGYIQGKYQILDKNKIKIRRIFL